MTDILRQAAKFIKSGNIVAFPTETVYGLGADASNEQACQKIFKIKKRPSINPLIVHVATMSQAKAIGEFNADALKLSEVFWPGPLSIVVPLRSGANIAESVLSGLTTIALRIPSHNMALELIRKSGTPIAAPSANPSGYISATTLEHVKEHFANDQDIFILEDNSRFSAKVAYAGGFEGDSERRTAAYLNVREDLSTESTYKSPAEVEFFRKSNDYKCQYGIESTIVDSTTNNLTILRDGFITLEALEKVLGKKLDKASSLMQIKAPGMMDKHYSPRVKMRLNAESLEANEVGLNFADSKLEGNFSLNLSLTGDLIIAASNLFASLRILDNYAELNGLAIAVASIPEVGIGVAINDRLKRAAVK
ncbi:L-threonylcarbamoyladenylate synthase [Candidatus Tisiphia endosymbiont of Hybos culiciformis]|uniref:L-threonylcarbamoyladenylate synthase n=1 Tax=Candidatus Tisiphia endosymbiont of Hybos culiciformis TaxID=3139331 RepID=UPI003CCB1570